MATLQQLYVNLGTGGVVASVSCVLFGLAVWLGYNDKVAPRTWSRPPEILKNILRQPYAFSWIFWSFQQTYPQLMDGIPGTGTRQKGWKGPKLKVNLDGIIMLKYHVLLFKVALVATALCILVVLPVTRTAECDVEVVGIGTCRSLQNLTDFERTTIAHIPPQEYNNTAATSSSTTAGSSSSGRYNKNPLNRLWIGNISSRYFAIALVSWIVYYYICRLVWKEWIENLALRRTFYLEYDHYAERQEEWAEMQVLKDTDVSREEQRQQHHHRRPPWLPHPELRETVPNISLYTCLYQLPNRITTSSLPDTATDFERQLAATVDFFDQCVPNQRGFTSSVVAVTILPEPGDVSQTWKRWYRCSKTLRQLRYIRRHIQRQMEEQQEQEEEWVFDDSNHLGSVDDNIGGKSLVKGKAKLSPEVVFDVHDPSDIEHGVSESDESSMLASDCPETKRTPPSDSPGDSVSFLDGVMGKLFASSSSWRIPNGEVVNSPQTMAIQNGSLYQESSLGEPNNESSEKQAPVISGEDPTPNFSVMPSVRSESSSMQDSVEQFRSDEDKAEAEARDSSHQQFFDRPVRYATFDVSRMSKDLGFEEETKMNILVSDIGIEQLNVYAREYAQCSSNACPYGFGGEIIRFSSLDRLKQLEAKALQQVREANAELVEARESVNRITSGRNQQDVNDCQLTATHDTDDPGTLKKKDDDLDSNEKTGFKLNNKNESKSVADEGPSMFGEAPVNVRQRLPRQSSKKRWEEAQAIAGTLHRQHRTRHAGSRANAGCLDFCYKRGRAVVKNTASIGSKLAKGSHPKKRIKEVVNILEHPTYAVVTFTSRQAAVAARQCLADAGAINRWIEFEELPVSPLADAPPCDIMFCRGCCRPVSLTISDSEKRIRRVAAITMFLLFCFCYTIPLAATSQLLNPQKLAKAFPDAEALRDPDNIFFQVLSGISSGVLYSVFLSFCPQLFKAIANFEGNVSSKRTAEDKALTYYWLFMLVTAFTGTALAQMLTEIFLGEVDLGDSIRKVLDAVAISIPTRQAPVWMNWLVVRITYTLPFMYLFQANTVGFSIIRWPWCSRLMRGGGSGGPPPYRIYVDSGTALICLVAIGPTCPLIAPLALIYFAVMVLLLRWLLVFVYRPWYDAGGSKWPALHEIIISATIFGQVLLTIILSLRNAFTPAVMILLSVLPTYMFSLNCKKHFLRPYNDASLLQTSRLDGWDVSASTSMSKREEYRRWLVDCHKASYVPICLAGTESFLTVEPAIVVSTRRDKPDSLRSQFRNQRLQRGGRFNRFDTEESSASLSSSE